MKIRTYIITTIFIFSLIACNDRPVIESVKNEPVIKKVNKELQDAIIEEHLENGAWKNGLFSSEWQEEIDKGLAKDSTIAYLWQQKSMALYKQGKYEAGLPFLNNAVKYDPTEWLPYRAFMKCIFAKTYRAAIKDFELAKTNYGNSIVMDHSYDFYIGISYLQLNEFVKAEKFLENDIIAQSKKHGEDWVHYLDYFYLGIAKKELRKYEEAIKHFDQALKAYPEFSEAIYYKANCIGKLGDKEKASELRKQASKLGDQGYTINEDNAIHEKYPYQLWKLK